MARLIDADKINYHDHTECMGHGDFETVRTVTDKEIAEIPAVDAVQVVRCRDCKHWNVHQINGRFTLRRCLKLSRVMGNSSFCSYGERKYDGPDF